MASAHAQDDAEVKESVDEELLTLQKQLKSPREMVRTFLSAMEGKDYELAFQCFDLTELEPETAAAKRKTYAVKLHLALTKYYSAADLVALSENPEEPEQPYPICRDEELSGVQLIRDADQIWKFSKSTARLLDGDSFDFLFMDEGVKQDVPDVEWSFPLWLQQRFPESWWGATFLLKDYQWLCLIVLLMAGFLIGQFSKLCFDYMTKIWFRVTATDVDDRPRKLLWTPVVALINISVWYYGMSLIDLPSSAMGIIFAGAQIFHGNGRRLDRISSDQFAAKLSNEKSQADGKSL